jgi:hypothetical protein
LKSTTAKGKAQTTAKQKPIVKAKSTGKSPVKRSWKERITGLWGRAVQLFFHEDVYYRMFGYLIFGLILFLITWAVVNFIVRKPNLLYDSYLIQKIWKADFYKTVGAWATKSFGESWQILRWDLKVSNVFAILALTIQYFVNHLIFVIPFILGLNFFKISRWNLGTIYFGFYTILWGIAIGSGPMLYPTISHPVFGPLLLFSQYGLVAWFAYLLLTVSTQQFAWLEAPSWLSWKWQQRRKKLWPVSFNPDQRELFWFGLAFLLAAAFVEARIFVHYNVF